MPKLKMPTIIFYLPRVDANILSRFQNYRYYSIYTKHFSCRP